MNFIIDNIPNNWYY